MDEEIKPCMVWHLSVLVPDILKATRRRIQDTSPTYRRDVFLTEMGKPAGLPWNENASSPRRR
ncbi:MAG: hypothetical protein ACREPQ_02165 [Rhodanobacter sp.]